MATLAAILNTAALVFFLLGASYAAAADVRLGWDPPSHAGDGPEFSEVAGYKFYYGLYDGQGYDDIAGVIDVGHHAAYTVAGLTPGRTYFFAVTAYDSVGNETGFSNVVMFTMPDTPAERTEVSSADGGPSPSLEASGSSMAVGSEGSLGENAAIAPGSGGHHEQPGAGLSQLSEPAHPSSLPWTNYRLSLTLAAEHRDDIGVMFRYQDRNNYYRFLWSDQHGSRRLEKRQAGAFMPLAEDVALGDPTQAYQLIVIAADEVLEIWIDGTLIFSVHDDSFLSGGIALYASGAGDNSFDDILVEDLETEQVLLWDDFSNGMFADWMIVDEGSSADLPAWSVESGVLVQRAGIEVDFVERSDPAHHSTFALYMP